MTRSLTAADITVGQGMDLNSGIVLWGCWVGNCFVSASFEEDAHLLAEWVLSRGSIESMGGIEEGEIVRVENQATDRANKLWLTTVSRESSVCKLSTAILGLQIAGFCWVLAAASTLVTFLQYLATLVLAAYLASRLIRRIEKIEGEYRGPQVS